MMTVQHFATSNPVSVQVSRFDGANGVGEFHLTIRPTVYASFERQLGWINAAYLEILERLNADLDSSVFRRFFCSDLPNQTSSLELRTISNPDFEENLSAVSWLNQPPAYPAKIAMWAYHLLDPLSELAKSKAKHSLSLKRGELTHHWDTNMYSVHSDNTYEQSLNILQSYCERLEKRNATFLNNVIRSWFFIKDVDTQYKPFVDARNDIFEIEGLTEDTHYIASTDVTGGVDDVKAHVSMDAYAVSGLRSEQIDYISALDYICPAPLYSTAFERATSVAYRDRKHVFISGTTSIDWQGKILFLNDVIKQLERVLINIEALLAQAQATLNNVNVFIVYLRDPLDQKVVRDHLERLLPDIPFVVVTAPVCRPAWLVEIEAVATVSEENPELPEF